MKYLGCAYYPEYWGRDRVRMDADLMRNAGINIVRIGEFAWTRMEPSEGSFTLDWLHECVTTLGEYDIDVMLCTPSATPPAWLTYGYPDTLVTRIDGSRAVHGGRRHYCMSSDTFRRHCARIAAKLATEFGAYKNVVAWQIDNEIGPEIGNCYCENCQARFRLWLKERYSTIEALNAAWGTGFWSLDYTEWNQVRLHGSHDMFPSRMLDSKRFWSDLAIDFCSHQANILRETDPGAIVTTNGMGPYYSPIDYYKLFAGLDVACDDLYFDLGTMSVDAAAMDIYRNIKPGTVSETQQTSVPDTEVRSPFRPAPGKRFWVTETGSAALSHHKPPHPDQFRAWMWSAFAHGAEAHMVFRWRTCLSGQEQDLQGILEHSGKPRQRYNTVQRAFQEAIALRPRLADLPLPTAEVAIVYDYQTIWAYESARISGDVRYQDIITQTHGWFYDRNIGVDIVSPQADLSTYKLVVLPTQVLVAESFNEQLRRYIDAGGVAVATGQLGMRDSNNNYTIEPNPIQALFGICIEGGMYLTSFVGPDEALAVPKGASSTVVVPVTAVNIGESRIDPVGTANVWMADLTVLNGAVCEAVFAVDAYREQAALVRTDTGHGQTLYLATTNPDNTLLDHVFEKGLSLASAPVSKNAIRHVEVIRRGDVTFAINHLAVPVEAFVGPRLKAIVGTLSGDETVSLEPYGVAILERA